ncbi:hypothetical protein [Labrys sp. ZIDIC5]|uniref:hypothetical protein n=1 Tax=Labrys sedimenti TaxID=3106036 RepID=UPI002ACADEA8|nr:hypothetical protein [Labrys sp. ZIDIC5]MDZ5448611.1 hypothetical protein [Labrys sp. ZIDIC5]
MPFGASQGAAMLRRDTPGLITPAEATLRIAKAKDPAIWRMESLGDEEQRAWTSFISNHDFDQLTRWLSAKYVSTPNEQNGFPLSPGGRRWTCVYSATQFLLDKLVDRTVVAKYLYVDGALEDLAGWECNDTFLKLLQMGGVRGKFGSLFLELYNQPVRKMDGWILFEPADIAAVSARTPPKDRSAIDTADPFREMRSTSVDFNNILDAINALWGSELPKVNYVKQDQAIANWLTAQGRAVPAGLTRTTRRIRKKLEKSK